MSDVVIQVDRLWKKYRLGVLGTGTLRHDFNRWLHRALGKPDPYAKVGEEQKGEKLKTERLKAENDASSSACQPVSVSGGISASQRFSISNLSSDEMWALRDISFEVKQGEILGIIGRNGAGKSTLLKILSRVTAPTSGEVRVKGRIASLLEVGTGFHPELTGRENIFLNGAILGMTKAEIKQKLDEIVAFAEIEKFLDTPVKRYSSGMYVRLAFAVAAHLEPEILIVDEVLAVGDVQFQKKCLGKMEAVSKQEGRTVLFVTHQLNMAREICRRGLVFEGGHLTCDRGVEEALSHYTGVSGRTALSGSRFIRCVQFGAADGPQREIQGVPFGGPLKILVQLGDLPQATLGLNLGIRNGLGKVITFFSTNPHDGVELPISNGLRIALDLDPCYLAPGLYTLDVAVVEPAVRILEEIACVARFEVIPRRVGGYWPYESRFGDFFPAHRWTVTPCPEHGSTTLESAFA
jgi:lipopolysaccharide transport system ATP-binding protein